MALRLLDTFSGIGGFSLAARMAGGYETVAFCEIDPFCRAVLAKHWPGVVIYEDITKIDPAELPEADIWTGGFPCQDISCAGKGAGLHGSRSGLFFEIVRLLHGVKRRPDWLLLENVPAILGRGLDRVLDELAGAGYTCWPVVMGAWAVGAPHKRDRVWIVGRRMDDAQDKRHVGVPANGAERTGLVAALRPAGAGIWREPCGPSTGDGLADPCDNGSRREASSVDGGGRRGATNRTPDVQAGQERRADQPDAEPGAPSQGGGLADAGRPGCEERHAAPKPGDPEQRESMRCPATWPSRPGQPQFDWEPPRLLVKPVGWSALRISGWMDGQLLRYDTNGTTTITRPSEVMRVLRQASDEEDVSENAGGSNEVQGQAVLQLDLHGVGENVTKSDTANPLSAQPTAHTESLPGVRDERPRGVPPYRRECGEQLAGQPDDSMRGMPHEMALAARQERQGTEALYRLWRTSEQKGLLPETLVPLLEIWRSLSHEERLRAGQECIGPRLVKRLMRWNKFALKAYGNSIVPQVAAQILRWIGGQP